MNLTTRQIEVVKLIATGNTIKETASLLGVSPKTIEKHWEGIKQRVGIQSMVQLAHWALAKRIVVNLFGLLLALPVFGGSAPLGWDPSPETNVTYFLYTGTNALTATNLTTAISKVNVGTNLTALATWTGTQQMRFVVTAARGSIESDPSNELSIRAPAAGSNLVALALGYSGTITGSFPTALFLNLKIVSPAP